jgi:hypothetical protein
MLVDLCLIWVLSFGRMLVIYFCYFLSPFWVGVYFLKKKIGKVSSLTFKHHNKKTFPNEVQSPNKHVKSIYFTLGLIFPLNNPLNIQ